MIYDLVESIAATLQKEADKNGRAMLVLPGGSSPRDLIKVLARQPLPWERIIVTTTDERCVPFTDEASNSGQIARLMAAEGILIEPVMLWRYGEINNEEIDMLVWPASVTVLGMGLDGHIASLFPGQSQQETRSRLISSRAPAPPHERVSMTLDALLDTGRLILLLPDEEKQKLYQEVSEGKHPDLPIAELFHAAGEKLEAVVF